MLSTTVLLAASMVAAPPLQLHPENPRYFLFRDKPAVLVTSGEHYGAVLNLDFDFRPYLDELQRNGFNLTRTFSGTYREDPRSFQIRDNTLAPAPGRYLAPWVEKDGKFDLDHFNPDYFRRLREFMTEASRRGIVVEYVLFCPLYEDVLWDINPMNARNNRNGVGRVAREQVYTLHHPELLERQLAFVRKAVAELNEFDNVYFEICNEPYFGGVTLDWQRKVADTIAETEKTLPNKHLVAQNIANGSARIGDPHPAVSIFNFHYASPPEAVHVNRHLNKPIAFDETGFKGTSDRVYRTQAWEFLMAGGSLFSHLDYSFTPDHEDGSAKVEAPTPGGGGPTFRKQLGVLKQFIEGFGLLGTDVGNGFVASVEPKELRDRLSGVSNRRSGSYGLYIATGPKARLDLDLSPETYHLEWIDPRDGRVLKAEYVEAKSGSGPGRPTRVTLDSPEYAEDVAVRIAPNKTDAPKAP